MDTNQISGPERSKHNVGRNAQGAQTDGNGEGEQFAAALRQLLGSSNPEAIQQQVAGATEIPDAPPADLKPKEPEKEKQPVEEPDVEKAPERDAGAKKKPDEKKAASSSDATQNAPIAQAAPVQNAKAPAAEDGKTGGASSTAKVSGNPAQGKTSDQEAATANAGGGEAATTQEVSGAQLQPAANQAPDAGKATEPATGPGTEQAQSGTTNQSAVSGSQAAQSTATQTKGSGAQQAVAQEVPVAENREAPKVQTAEASQAVQETPVTQTAVDPKAAAAAAAQGTATGGNVGSAARTLAAAQEGGTTTSPVARAATAATTAESFSLSGTETGDHTLLAKAKATGTGNGASSLPGKTQDKIVQQVQDLMKKAAASKDGNSISVRVDPPELGKVTVKITQRDSHIYARIIPDNPDVEEVLRNRVSDVTHVLTAAGLKPDQVHVSIGRERSDGEAFSNAGFGAGGGNNGSMTGQNNESSGRSSQQREGQTLPNNAAVTSVRSAGSAALTGAATTLEASWVA